jgi:hypothetical protein
MAITSSIRRHRVLVVLVAATAALPAAAEEGPSEAKAKAHAAPSTDETRQVRFAVDELDPGLEVRVVPRAQHVPEGAGVASCTQDCEL